MSDHEHRPHQGEHGAGCGHTAVRHESHVDYLHDGHLHHPHEDHVDEHAIAVDQTNPDGCGTPADCAGHVHEAGCGHEPLPHGDHVDFLVDGRLHHPHEDHCDDHGPLQVAV